MAKFFHRWKNDIRKKLPVNRLKRNFRNRRKGCKGEKDLYSSLRSYSRDGARFVKNAYLKCDGKTTELDLIMVAKAGIFVFESKNYCGDIYGSPDQRVWTQVIRSTDKYGDKTTRNSFLSPLVQNRGHISAIRRTIRDEGVPIYGVTVFSKRCRLKKGAENYGNEPSVRLRDVRKAVHLLSETSTTVLSQDEIEKFYNILLAFSLVPASEKRAHVRQVKESISSKPSCPMCNGYLVRHTANKGPRTGKMFYGCSNYPKCRYTKNIEEESERRNA